MCMYGSVPIVAERGTYEQHKKKSKAAKIKPFLSHDPSAVVNSHLLEFSACIDVKPLIKLDFVTERRRDGSPGKCDGDHK